MDFSGGSCVIEQVFTTAAVLGNAGLPNQLVGLTGATAAGRYVGATTGGAPVSGTFLTGDWVTDQTGSVWVCTSGGTSGTWIQIASFRYAANVGDGTNKSFTITHNLGTLDVTVTVYRNSDGADVQVTTYRPTINTVRLVFSKKPTSNQYRAVIRS